MKGKKTLAFTLFLLGGIVLGYFLTGLVSNVSFLSWLAFGKTFGVGYPTPLSVNFVIFKLTFGFSFDLNLVTILSVLLCLFLYKHFSKGM